MDEKERAAWRELSESVRLLECDLDYQMQADWPYDDPPPPSKDGAKRTVRVVHNLLLSARRVETALYAISPNSLTHHGKVLIAKALSTLEGLPYSLKCSLEESKWQEVYETCMRCIDPMNEEIEPELRMFRIKLRIASRDGWIGESQPLLTPVIAEGEQPPGDDKKKPQAVWLGERRVQIGKETIILDDRLARLLAALVTSPGSAATKPELVEITSIEDTQISRLMKKLADKLPGYITLPRKRGAGGYSTTVENRAAKKEV